MSRRARLFSEFLEESVVGLATAPTAVSSVNQDVFTTKRRNTGLNSRFDRMVETMNVTHRSPKSARHRARSTSSTSGSSVPRTPIHAYDEYHREGRLGSEFAVIKMGKPSGPSKRNFKSKQTFPWDRDSSSDAPEAPPPPVPLPAWLETTFSTLTKKHPLRLLLPRRTNTEPSPSSPKAVQDAEDDRFSFCAPADPIDISPPAEPFTQSTQTSPRPTEPAFIHHPASLPDAPFGVIPPFSTPGPASSVISDSLSFAPLREPTFTECIPSTPQIQHPTPVYPFASSFTPAAPSANDNTRPSVPIPQVHGPETSYTDHPPSLMASLHSNLTYSPERSYSPEDFYPNPHLADDPSTNNSAYMDIYSTPGPGYRTVPPVYFDSPTEDPSASDPMEPVYEVDSLDFRWEPFIHKAGSGKVHVPAPLVGRDSAIVSDYYYETRVEPDGEDDKAGQLYASINMGPTAERDASPGPFSFAPPADDLPPTPNEHRENSEDGTAATPERPQFFAPVPGIFISPLRGDEMPKTPLKKSEAAQDGGHALSQTSNDSIEDWDDATD